MTNWKFVNRAIVLVLGAGVFVVSAFAAKVCEEGPLFYPGVDETGNLSDDEELGGVLQCRLCFKTGDGSGRLKCSGTVENQSGGSQKYKNDPFVNMVSGGALGAGVDKSQYRVKTNGNAKVSAKGTALLGP